MHIHTIANTLYDRRGRVVAWIVVACLAPALMLLLCCLLYDPFAFPLGMGPVEYKDLSYSQYVSKVGVEGFDPTEGRQISFKRCVSIDSSDYWWKLSVPVSQYQTLRHTEDRAAMIGKAVKPVRKATSDDSRMPRHWPTPSETPPTWWNPLPSGPGVECTRWESQLSGRAVGRYWVYDRRTEVLWAWRWNRQWYRFDDSQSEAARITSGS